MTNISIDRRRFLLAGSAVTDGGYGELVPVKDQATGRDLLKLPRGSEYLSLV